MEIGYYVDTIWPYLGPPLGFGLAFLLISRLMREKRRPSATVAWMLVIVWIPYIGVPLYLIFGGRKISKLTRRKSRINIAPPNASSGTVKSSPFGVISKGNRTEFQQTGVIAFESLVREIKQARTSIEIATFILSHDAIGRHIVRELSLQAKKGIEVRLLLDAVGSFGKKTLYILELEKAGGKIERFMPVLPFASLGKANLRNHRKIAIFDNKRAIIGGRNIGSEYMGPAPSSKRWKDLSLLIEGPAVMQLSATFEADWAFACRGKNCQPREIKPVEEYRGPELSTIEIMASGPDTLGDPLYEKILSIIQEADTNVAIVTPYYIPDEVIQRSLIVKARTGKSVKLLIPKKSNHPVTDLARASFLRELSEAGVEVLLYTSGMLHGKAILVDNTIAMTGSANIDLRSLFVNYELGAFFYDNGDIQAISNWIQELSTDAEPFHESEKQSFLRSTAEDLSRLVTPLL
ncbi:MAG: phospholipase D-like domain-containing protein [Opitutaceae bacterium]|nr:phospholipase D-like domain-containing protein [Opitutaceae bacterium]